MELVIDAISATSTPYVSYIPVYTLKQDDCKKLFDCELIWKSDIQVDQIKKPAADWKFINISSKLKDNTQIESCVMVYNKQLHNLSKFHAVRIYINKKLQQVQIVPYTILESLSYKDIDRIYSHLIKNIDLRFSRNKENNKELVQLEKEAKYRVINYVLSEYILQKFIEDSKMHDLMGKLQLVEEVTKYGFGKMCGMIELHNGVKKWKHIIEDEEIKSIKPKKYNKDYKDEEYEIFSKAFSYESKEGYIKDNEFKLPEDEIQERLALLFNLYGEYIENEKKQRNGIMTEYLVDMLKFPSNVVLGNLMNTLDTGKATLYVKASKENKYVGNYVNRGELNFTYFANKLRELIMSLHLLKANLTFYDLNNEIEQAQNTCINYCIKYMEKTEQEKSKINLVKNMYKDILKLNSADYLTIDYEEMMMKDSHKFYSYLARYLSKYIKNVKANTDVYIDFIEFLDIEMEKDIYVDARNFIQEFKSCVMEV